MAPRDLLNRWIIPLENHIDYLTLHTGKKIQVPFEQLLVFLLKFPKRVLKLGYFPVQSYVFIIFFVIF